MEGNKNNGHVKLDMVRLCGYIEKVLPEWRNWQTQGT